MNLAWALEWRMAAIKNGIKGALAYRGEFLVGLIGSAIVPVGIQLMLWYAIFQSGNTTHFAGMDYPELLAYTWTSLLFSQIRGGDYDFELIEQIRTGTLSNFLLRPVGVVEFVFFQGFGEKLYTALVCLFFGLIATIFTKLTVIHLLMGLFLAILGNMIAYLLGASLAAAAFYWENAFAVLMVKNMVVSLLCGEVLPLSIVPEKYSFIWKSTPFYLFVYGPTQIALGKWDTHQFYAEVGFALLWIFGFWAALKLLWTYSINRYQGIGG
jgi:ABC-2 type transport system permease protein